MSLLAVLTVAAYANSFVVPFILDDAPGIEREEAIRPPVSLEKLLSTDRPVATASLAVNYAYGELDVIGYHVLNLLLHIGCGLLFFGFARHMLRLPGLAERYGQDADWLALFAASIFLLHPIQTESVTYIIQRAEILVAGALIASLWFASTIAQSMAPGRLFVSRGQLPRRSLAGLTLLGIGGALSKESFFVVPALFALYDYCCLSAGRFDALKKRWRLHAVLTAIGLSSLLWGLWVASHSAAGGSLWVSGYVTDPISPWRYLTWQFGVLVYYAQLIAFPYDLCFDCGYLAPWPVLHSWLGDKVLLPALVITAVAATAWWMRSRWPSVTFCIFGSLIVLAPTSSIVPLSNIYFEHRLYLPIAFVALLVGLAAFELGQHAIDRGWLGDTRVRRGALAATAVVCAVLASLTFLRNEVWAGGVTLYEDTIAKAPENRRAHFELGMIYQRRGDYELAILRYEDSIRLNPTVSPTMVRSYMALGVMHLRLGRPAQAALAFKELIRAEPNLELAHRNLAWAYRALGRDDEARAADKVAAEIRSYRGN